jgi:hypothetical protein
MRVGSVEYVIIGFPGNRFTGEIVPALQALVDQGTINIIDLAFVKKDAAGEVEAFELSALTHEEAGYFAGLTHEVSGLLSDGDIRGVAASLEPDSSAALLVWENAWAARFAEAVMNADGVLLAHEKVPADVVAEALEDAAGAAAI